MPALRFALGFLVAAWLSASAWAQSPTNFDASLGEFVKSFKGLGALEDGSKAPTPEETIRRFHLAPGLEAQVVAHEPTITQPLNLHFDERGRLWVVQYLQYPFPAGLKVINYDQYLRAVFDKVPPPPPHHFKGRDKIAILEDKDGDGVFETHKDFLKDLNIARSVVTGRGGVWVLNPPYLLFYPDQNRDDLPDGDPEVVLDGFGLQDTHSGANSLAWGVDGWLYGAHGSICTADIKGVKFLGQGIWRYNPATKDFEVFAEGGGNTYSLEFDAQGRAFSGSNFGETRGMYYPQGSAGIKMWGKHGPLMNPYSFGWFEHMAHEGYMARFAQTLVIYEGGAIPALEQHIVAPMSLMNRVVASKLLRDTSTFRTVDIDPVLLTDDRWFRPVDTKTGPDGAIYLADWCDSRLSHVDPRDTWDREHGRVYRLQAVGAKPAKPFDLAKSSNDELIKVLSHPNKWFRQTALRIFHDRHDVSIVPKLKKLVAANTGQLALEAFWALNASGGFNEAYALQTLDHQDELVRYWTIRLLGDRYPPARYSSASRQPAPLPEALVKKLTQLARKETDVQVRGQLASSAKRLPGANALPIVRELLYRSEDVNDKHLPLLLWWAMESKAVLDRARLLSLLQERRLWQTPLFSQFIISRLGQRYLAERTEENFNTAAQLFALAPTPRDVDELVKGMEAGLQGDRVPNVPAKLQEKVAEVWKSRPHTPTLVSFALRLNYAPAGAAVVEALADPQGTAGTRKPLIDLVSERHIEAAVPVLLDLLQREQADGGRLDLINALARFSEPEIAAKLLALYPAMSAELRGAAVTALSSRGDWALQLLEAVDRGAIKNEQITVGNLLTMQKLAGPQGSQLIKKHWGNLRPSTEEKEKQIQNIRALLGNAKGSLGKGREVFKVTCAICHTLNGEGTQIGPDLTGYERDNLDYMLPAIVDPSLGIREEYTTFNLAAKDGQELTGFLVENKPQSVTMMDAVGHRTTFAREEIQTLAASAISLMPEGLLNALSAEQTLDLFAYLMKK